MKVQLLQPIPALGKIGQVVEVSDAQARNYLFPKKLAIVASGLVMATMQRQETEQQRRREKRARQLTTLIKKIEAVAVKLYGKANLQGKLFASIKSIDIQNALEKQFGIILPGLKTTPNHLKALGQHSVTVVIDDHQTAVINVIIEHGP